jgi:hypothetical protein
MPYAILRHVKFTSQGQASKATGHNYRTDRVPNADEQAPHPNIEFVNVQQRDYWEVAEERIKEAGIKIRRSDQIRCVEIVLTASPEFFKRDADGRAVDMQDSQWLKDIRTYLTETFGEKNVVALQLQQDEKSPHVHAVVVPITEDGRLSARDVFNPLTLRGYQTKFAEAMKPHGLTRGVEHSQAEHQPMKKMYGQQGQTAAELGAQVGPASSYQDVSVKRPGVLDYGNIAKWEAETSAQVNEKARAQVEAANQRAEKAQNLVLENAAAKEQVRVLQKQLSTSEKLKEGHYKELVGAKEEKSKLAINLAQGGGIPQELLKLGAKLREEDRLDTKKKFEVHLVSGTYVDDKSYLKGLQEQGFKFRKSTEDNPIQVIHPKYGSEFTYAEIRPNGRKISEQLEEQLQVRRAYWEGLAAEQKQAEARKVEQARQKVATHELSLMDRAISRWSIRPADLTACLIVPTEKVKAVQNALTIPGSSYACPILVQGEPFRRDGLEAVYVHYQASFAHQIGAHFSRIREIGGEVYEHAGSQTRREQLQAQPQQKTQERQQEPTKSKGFGIGD